MNFYILIPAYKPEQSMIPFIKELKEQTDSILVVNDGSGAEYSDTFRRIADMGITVIDHPVNRGKGVALRTGISYIKETFPDCEGIITADCDGQHTVRDIMRVAQALSDNPDKLIVGGRALRENVPLRSRFGNSAMRNLYRLASGYKLRDTQTGLRGIPSSLFEKLLSLKGDRYEYEMNMLLYLKQWNTQPLEIRIDTIYIDNNAGSHFDTLKDSARIMKHILLFFCRRMAEFFKFIGSSLISYLFEYGVFQLLLFCFPTLTVLFSNIISRVCSSVLNYIINRKLVFRNKGKHSVIKYYGLVLAVMLLSSLVISALSNLLSLTGLSLDVSASIVKPVVDLLFFVLNFFVQRNFIFNGNKEK